MNDDSSDVVFASYVPETKEYKELYRFEFELVGIYNLVISADHSCFTFEVGMISTGCESEESCKGLSKSITALNKSGVSGIWRYGIDTEKMTQIYKETDFSN